MNHLVLRCATAVSLLALVLMLLFVFPPVMALGGAIVLVCLAAYEWLGLSGPMFSSMQCVIYPVVVLGFAGIVEYFQLSILVEIVVFALFVCALPILLRCDPKQLPKLQHHQQASIMLGCLGVWVLLALFFGLVFLYQVEPLMLLLCMSLVWVADSAAFFVGRFLGRHPLLVHVSPKKTLEGAVGALAMVALVAFLYYPWVQGLVVSRWTWVALAVISAMLGILGDLVESFLKRWRGLKDSGNILPGHGGVLDRIDALLPVLPYWFLVFHWMH